jgi:hypothetical protein
MFCMSVELGLVCHVKGRKSIEVEIWGSHGGEYEGGCFLGCSAV